MYYSTVYTIIVLKFLNKFLSCVLQIALLSSWSPLTEYKYKPLDVAVVWIKFHLQDSAAICAKSKKLYGQVVRVNYFERFVVLPPLPPPFVM
jgi:hypothetical protein